VTRRLEWDERDYAAADEAADKLNRRKARPLPSVGTIVFCADDAVLPYYHDYVVDRCTGHKVLVSNLQHRAISFDKDRPWNHANPKLFNWAVLPPGARETRHTIRPVKKAKKRAVKRKKAALKRRRK
jgi:hypothetical protein